MWRRWLSRRRSRPALPSATPAAMVVDDIATANCSMLAGTLEGMLGGCRQRPLRGDDGEGMTSCATPLVAFPAAHPAALRASRVLLRPDRKGPVSRMEIADSLGSDTITRVGTSPLELNLFEDPTGGLASGPAEELTTTEIEAQVRLMASAYNSSVFYLLYTPFVDVVRLVVEQGLLPQSAELRGGGSGHGSPRATGGGAAGQAVGDGHVTGAAQPAGPSAATHGPRRPEEVMAQWFADGQTVLKDPHRTTVAAMGERRWALLGDALAAFYTPIEEVMPLTRVVRQHHLPETIYVPFLRQLAMSLVPPESRRSTIPMLPGLILGLANGRAPGLLQLPENHTERVRLVAELFLGVAQEAGNTDLAYLGIQLLRANDIMTPFRFQKQLTNVFSAAARLQTDWLARSTGQLADIYPRWADYAKKVKQDNVVRLCQLHEARGRQASLAGEEVAAAPLKGGGHPEGRRPSQAAKTTSAVQKDGEDTQLHHQQQQHEYFTSRRAEDVERISALERNIEAALLSRGTALSAEVSSLLQRRRQRQKGQTAAPGETGAGRGHDTSSPRPEAEETDDGEPRDHLGGDDGGEGVEGVEGGTAPHAPRKSLQRKGPSKSVKQPKARRRRHGTETEKELEEVIDL